MISRMRNYPRQMVIGDNIWDIIFCRKIPGEPAGIVGLCDPSENKIYIKMGQTPEERFKTFCHEILHCMEYEFELKIPHDLIYKLETPIFRLLFDNLRY